MRTPPWLSSAAEVEMLILEAAARLDEFTDAVQCGSDDWPEPHNKFRNVFLGRLAPSQARWYDSSRHIGGDLARGSLRFRQSRQWWTLQAGFLYMMSVLDESYVTTSLLFGDPETQRLAQDAATYAWALWPLAAAGVSEALRGRVASKDAVVCAGLDLAHRRKQIDQFGEDWAERANELRKAAVPLKWQRV